MRHECCFVLSGVVAILGAAGLSLRAAEVSPVRESDRTAIIVRTYTQPASADDVPRARRTASAILERAGIQVVWLECALPGEVTPAGACTQPPRRNELLVRIMSAGAVDQPIDVNTLGFAIVDLNAATGALASVYADRVSVLAQHAGVDEGELLGRTIAHELGHLLLGTNRHAAQGLMRGSWSSEDLRHNRPAQWFFGGKESEAMRSGIASRLRS